MHLSAANFSYQQQRSEGERDLQPDNFLSLPAPWEIKAGAVGLKENQIEKSGQKCSKMVFTWIWCFYLKSLAEKFQTSWILDFFLSVSLGTSLAASLPPPLIFTHRGSQGGGGAASTLLPARILHQPPG